MRVLLHALGVSCALLCACADPGPELALAIREPADRRLFASIASLHLRAERDGRALAESMYPPTADHVQVSGVPYGPHTIFVLEGATLAGDVVARGRTCPFDYAAPGAGGPSGVALSFAPTNSFAPTVGEPVSDRVDPLVWTLPSADVFVAGGAIAGEATDSVESFFVASSVFSMATGISLTHARIGAEATALEGVGTFISGGFDGDGNAASTAELFLSDSAQFVSIESDSLGARAGHRAVSLGDDRVLLTGGVEKRGAPALGTTALVRLQPDGSATVSEGPPLQLARHSHAAVVASGVPVLIGGYGADGAPLASIEVLVPDETVTLGHFSEIASLRTARAEATASLLADGTILVVGGVGATGTPLLDAELYNPFTQMTTVYPVAKARSGHTATTLPDGRVLIVGGIGVDSAGMETPLSSVELFIPGVGFVSERPLKSARVGHRAISLCDDTVLVVGGGSGAEIYTPPP